MTTGHSGLLLYVKNTLLPNDYYDVIGYAGDTSNGIISEDNSSLLISEQPVITYNGSYYAVLYDETQQGYTLITEITDTDQLHLYQTEDTYILYAGTSLDSENNTLVSNEAHLITIDISIQNISTKIAAYRTYSLEIAENHTAVRITGNIYDPHELVINNAGLTFTPTNPDSLTITTPDPTANSTSLLTFEGYYPEGTIVTENSNCTTEIALYKYNGSNSYAVTTAKTVVLSDNNISITTYAEITDPGIYYLYIPVRKFKLNGNNSGLTLIQFTIIDTSSPESQQGYYTISPKVGTTLGTIDITFPNIQSLFGKKVNKKLIQATIGSQEPYSTEIYDISTINGNVYEITFPEGAVTNQTDSDVEVDISIPAGVIRLTEEDENEAIDFTYTLYKSTETVETVTATYETSPANNSSVQSIQNLTINFSIDSGHFISKNSQLTANAVKVQRLVDGNFEDFKICSKYITNSSTSFTFGLSTAIQEYGTYKFIIPKSFFLIDGTSYVDQIEVTLIKDGVVNEDTDNTFFYELVNINNGISKRYNDSIITTRTGKENVISVYLLPRLTYRKYNDDKTLNSQGILQSTSTDPITVKITYQYYNIDNKLVVASEDLAYNTEWYITDKMPNDSWRYIWTQVEFTYQNQTIIKTFDIQQVDYDTYLNILGNGSGYALKNNIDIDSMELTKLVYGCSIITNITDVIEEYSETEDETYKIAQLTPNTRVRLGNLSGIYNETFGTHQPQDYGLYGESVYLTGNFYLNNGKSLMDISDSITLGINNTHQLQENLENLQTKVNTTLDTFKGDITNLRNGMDATIGNYISTNKDSFFKMGVDYSMWALGSAGISLINPNAKFRNDNYGVQEIDPTTIGDGDEYITLQGDKIKFSTYNPVEQTVIIDENTSQIYTRNRVICTNINPQSWVYMSDSFGAFKPFYDTGDKNYKLVPFYFGYVTAFPSASDCIGKVTTGDNNQTLLRYVAIEINNDIISIATSKSDSTQFYSFNNFYIAPSSIVTENPNDGQYLVYQENSNERVSNDSVYYVPETVIAGVFEGGKLNTNLIDTENLVVRNLIATEAGNYKLENNKLDIADTSKPYVSIDGNTGKLIANKGEFYGKVIARTNDYEDAIKNNEGKTPQVAIDPASGEIQLGTFDYNKNLFTIQTQLTNSNINKAFSQTNRTNNSQDSNVITLSEDNNTLLNLEIDSDGNITTATSYGNNVSIGKQINYKDIYTDIQEGDTYIESAEYVKISGINSYETLSITSQEELDTYLQQGYLISIKTKEIDSYTYSYSLKIGAKETTKYAVIPKISETPIIFSILDSSCYIQIQEGNTTKDIINSLQNSDTKFIFADNTAVQTGTSYDKVGSGLYLQYGFTETTYLGLVTYTPSQIQNGITYTLTSYKKISYNYKIVYSKTELEKSRTILANDGLLVHYDENNFFKSTFDTNNNCLVNVLRTKGLGFALTNGYVSFITPSNYTFPFAIPVLYCYLAYNEATYVTYANYLDNASSYNDGGIFCPTTKAETTTARTFYIGGGIYITETWYSDKGNVINHGFEDMQDYSIFDIDLTKFASDNKITLTPANLHIQLTPIYTQQYNVQKWNYGYVYNDSGDFDHFSDDATSSGTIKNDDALYELPRVLAIKNSVITIAINKKRKIAAQCCISVLLRGY